MESQRVVQCRDVTVSYTGTTNVLEGINLQVNTGESVAVVGPSGCGKSTLLRVIAGLLPPTSGAIQASQRHLGFVFQEPTLFAWRTALANVALPLEIKGVNEPERSQRALQTLQDVGLGEAANLYPKELSGGMKQRVALARALVEHSQLLLLDEPFAALDALRRERFCYEMWRLARKKNLSLVLVTHSITEAVWMSHRVLIMTENPGQIVADIPVSLPDQRDSAILSTNEFTAICTKIRTVLAAGGGYDGY